LNNAGRFALYIEPQSAAGLDDEQRRIAL